MRENRVDVSLLLLRLVLGTVFILHGGQKLFGWLGGHGMEEFIGMMGKMGMPPVVAWLVACGEFFGGLGVFFGLLTRLASVGPIASMAGAVFLVHLKNGFFIEPGKMGIEYALTLLVIAVSVLVAGPGVYSLDAALRGSEKFRVEHTMRPLTA
jgi:putative oxidoreductase